MVDQPTAAKSVERKKGITLYQRKGKHVLAIEDNKTGLGDSGSKQETPSSCPTSSSFDFDSENKIKLSNFMLNNGEPRGELNENPENTIEENESILEAIQEDEIIKGFLLCCGIEDFDFPLPSCFFEDKFLKESITEEIFGYLISHSNPQEKQNEGSHIANERKEHEEVISFIPFTMVGHQLSKYVQEEVNLIIDIHLFWGSLHEGFPTET